MDSLNRNRLATILTLLGIIIFALGAKNMITTAVTVIALIAAISLMVTNEDD